jgi:2-phosphoglycerate kinase
MPIDLVEPDPRIIVHDRTGARLPYSRGIMATSLLATGITTEEAYRLASLIQSRLLNHDRHEVENAELVALVQRTLAEQEAPGVAQRWLAWRHAKRSGRPIVVVLAGAPGVGKSTIATRLAVRLDITRVVTTDAIREVLRLVVPPVVLPELHMSTFEVLDEADVTSPSTAGFVRFGRQCEAVCHAAAAVASRMATEHRSVILEGAHLLPGQIARHLAGHPARPTVVERLLTIDHVNRHGEQLAQRAKSEPLRGGGRHLDGLESIRAIQTHLTTRAVVAKVGTFDAHLTSELTQHIVDEIAAHAIQNDTHDPLRATRSPAH